ncbi:MAG: choice-of-anchor A family protein [Candidatus Neomarinimicrobiota bacterium]
MNKVTQLFTLLALTSACGSTTVIKQDAPDTSTSTATSTDPTVGVQGPSKVVPVDATTWHNTSTATSTNTSTNTSTGGAGAGGSAGAVSPDSGGEGGEGAAPTFPTGGATTVTGGSSGELGGEGGGILPTTGGSAGAVTGGTGPLLEGGSGGEVPELVPVMQRSTLLPDGMLVPVMFTAGDFTVQNNLGRTVYGPVVVGGDLSLADTVVVVGIDDECNGGHTERDALIVNGSITGASADRWGNIRAGGVIDIDSEFPTACGSVFPESVELPIDISSLHDVLLAQSEHLATLDPNGSVTENLSPTQIPGLSLNGTDDHINVFLMTSDQLREALHVDVITPVESTTIINVTGEHVVLKTFDAYSYEQCKENSSRCKNILWNLPDALSVTVSGDTAGVYIQGTILAPKATFNSGTVRMTMHGSILVNVATWAKSVTLGNDIGAQSYPFTGQLCNDDSPYPCTTWH